MPARFELGIVSSAFRPLGLSVPEMARRAADLGFEYIDLAPAEGGWDGPLALPVRERFAATPRSGFTTSVPRPPATRQQVLESFRGAPGCRLEPTALGILRSVAEVREFVAEAPELRITLDTGHVAAWGDDPCALVDLADWVQIRQAAKGIPQARAQLGAVDFAAFFAALKRSGYRGGVSVEYFDLPDRGMPLDDPLGHALELAAFVRPLL
jgi:sugar phosphate isomerase/epimerase